MVNVRRLVYYYLTNGYRKTKEHYRDLMEYGWEFLCNVSPVFEDMNEEMIRDKLNPQGQFGRLEIFIGKVAFDKDGNKSKRSKALFLR